MATEAPDGLNARLAALHAERVATWAPEALQVNIDQRQRLVDAIATTPHVRAGDRLPPAALIDVEGGELRLDTLAKDGAVALIFFRFAGCPACNIALPYYDRHLAPALAELGIPLVAVSPQVPDRLREIRARHALHFTVASDPDNNLGRELGILYSYDEASRAAALEKGRSIGEVTGTGTWELPMPAAILVDRDLVVRFADVSPDWLVRTEAERLIEAARQALANVPA